MTGARRRPARAFVDQPLRDLAAAERLARSAAAAWGLTETPRLLRAGMNALFAADDVIIRVSEPTVPGGVALELAAVLGEAGIRVPQPVREDVVADGTLSATAWHHPPDLHPVDAVDFRADGGREAVARII